MEFEPPRATEQELLAEQLTEAEVRLVLERLSAEQFECPNATVGAVVEATGTTPITIARILGQIRKTAFEERFAETFLVHEERLDDLEESSASLGERMRSVETRVIPPVLPRKLEVPLDWTSMAAARVASDVSSATTRRSPNRGRDVRG